MLSPSYIIWRNQRLVGKQCRSRWGGSFWATSSRFTQFANSAVFSCLVVKELNNVFIKPLLSFDQFPGCSFWQYLLQCLCYTVFLSGLSWMPVSYEFAISFCEVCHTVLWCYTILWCLLHHSVMSFISVYDVSYDVCYIILWSLPYCAVMLYHSVMSVTPFSDVFCIPVNFQKFSWGRQRANRRFWPIFFTTKPAGKISWNFHGGDIFLTYKQA